VPAGARAAASRITLRGALIALGVLLVIINVGAAVWDAQADRERTERRALRDLSNLTSLLAEQTASVLEAVDLVLRDAVREGSAAKVAAAAPRLRDEMVHIPQVAAFLVLDADGRVIARTHEAPAVETNVERRAYFTAHRDGRAAGLFFSEPFRTVTDGRWRFAISRRLETADGRFEGVVVAAMELEVFDRLYRAIDLGGGGFITLRSQNGTVITRVPDPLASRGRSFPIPTSMPDAARRPFHRLDDEPDSERARAPGGIRGARISDPHTERGHRALGLHAMARRGSRIALRTFLVSAAMLVLIALAAWGLARRERALQRSQGGSAR
jgi:hypothetical protein